MSLVIEFGSRQHGCHDSHSDRDLMLIYDDSYQLSEKKYAFERLGYSVTVCSRKKANYLSKSGGLFIRHVVFEGRMVDGNIKQLKSLRSSWMAASNYDAEIHSNQEMLAVLERVPNNQLAGAVINDILICSIRNVLIRKLANEGVYLFSWKDVIRESVTRGFIKHNEIAALLLARRLKNIYRNGAKPIINDQLIGALESISRNVIDKSRKIRFGKHREIISLPDDQDTGSYAQLRAIELVCSYYSFDKSMNKYIQAIKDPNYFCNLGPNKAINRDAA